MTTERQTQANRENAKRSTGPTTAAGKANVRYNAMKHGLLAEAALLPDEDEATFREFSERIRINLSPVGEIESILVEQIINCFWRLRRLSHVEAGLFVHESAAAGEEYWRAAARRLEVMPDEWLAEQFPLTSRQPVAVISESLHEAALEHAEEADELRRTPLGELGAAFARDAATGNGFSKLSRYEASLNRTLDRTFKQLDELQQKRAAPGDSDAG